MGNFSFGYVPGKLTGINDKEAEKKTEVKQEAPKADAKSRFLNRYEIRKMKAEVISKVSIPMYFKDIIEPQLPGYYDTYPINFDADPRVCCPLHDEDTPSFRFYEETHSFYCFGCQKGGRDVTVLHRLFAERLNGRAVDEAEAVSYLYNYFIRGKNVGYLDNIQTEVEDESTKKAKAIDSMRFSAYENQFEKTITSDSSIDLELKKKMWHTADAVDALVSLGMIDAKDAKEYLEAEIKKETNKE